MPTPQLLVQARAAYIDTRYEEALSLNEQAVEAGCQVGLRYAGLCLFRLNRWEESRTRLEQALSVLGDDQRAYVLNHLGATLRALGEYDAAEQTLLEGLESAAGPEHADARGRLHGSLGALYDELRFIHRAVAHYARFEELMRLHGTELKRANAVGLLARHAVRADDLDRAEELGREELQIAERHGQRALIVSARCHLAYVQSKRSEEAAEGPAGEEAAAKHASRARELYQQAIREADEAGLTRRRVTARRSLGRFLTEQGDLGAAWAALQEAEQLTRDHDVAEHVHAGVYEALARWASRAHLHGEALHYMQRAWERREKLQSAHPRLRAAREARSQALLRELATEAVQVTRSPTEIDQLEEIDPDWESRLDEGRLPHWRWLQDARKEAEAAWTARLGPAWDELQGDVQSDLIQAHTLYRSTTDLSVVVFLLARAVERLARQVPVNAGGSNNRQPTLRTLVQRMPKPLRCELEKLHDAQGRCFDLVKLRNDFAHGNPMTVDRLAADAVLRVLHTTVIPALLTLPDGES